VTKVPLRGDLRELPYWETDLGGMTWWRALVEGSFHGAGALC